MAYTFAIGRPEQQYRCGVQSDCLINVAPWGYTYYQSQRRYETIATAASCVSSTIGEYGQHRYLLSRHDVVEVRGKDGG